MASLIQNLWLLGLMKKNTSLVEYFLLLNISPLLYNNTVFHQISFGI